MYVIVAAGKSAVKAEADLSKVLDQGSGQGAAEELRYYASNSSAYLDARGLRANSFSLNGIVIEDHSISSNLMQLLGR